MSVYDEDGKRLEVYIVAKLDPQRGSLIFLPGVSLALLHDRKRRGWAV